MKKHYFYSERILALFSKLSKIISLFLTVFIFLGVNSTIKAQSGIYESYAILNSNGGVNVYYDLQANYLINPDFNGANLGTFYSGNTLILNGAQNKVFKCNTDDIINGKFYYRIYKTTDVALVFIESTIFWTSNDGLTGSNCGGSDQNQTWKSNGANINVLNGLCPGIYYLEIYTTADFTYTASGGGSGTHFAHNGGANYKATFTVEDNQVPTISTVPVSAITNAGCTATGVVLTAPTTGDNCSVSSVTHDHPSTTYPLGNTTVTWTVTDGSGNIATDTQVVSVTDNVNPTLTAIANKNENTTATCNFTIPDYTGLTTASDNCTTAGSIIKTQSPVAGTVISGHNTTQLITVIANDGNANNVTTTFTITLKDVTPPVTPTLADINVGQCNGTPTAPTTIDACAGTITGTTSTNFPITTQGTTIVTWTFNDGNGNSTTANQNVTVNDTVAPVPNVATLPTITGQCSATVTAPTATDVCSGIITGTTASPLSYSTQGTFNIVWTYNDGNGNTTTQNQTIIVDDTVAPVTLTLADINVGQCSGTPPTPTTTDACSGTISGTTSTIFPITTQGTTVVTWTFNDGNGNLTTANQNVILDDTVAPITPALANVNVGQCSGTPPTPTTTDACVGTISGTTSTIFPITAQGTTVVTWTFNDGNGNSTTANQNVIVDDTVAPITPTLANVNVGQCSGTPPTPTTTDACVGTISGTTSTIFPITAQGTTVVTWTFNDDNGNSTTANQNVIVDDTIKPSLTAIANRNENIVSACNFTIPDYTGLTTASDNCTPVGSIIKTQSPVSGTVISGYNTTQLITITADDGNGNIESTTFTISLKDITPPTIICPATATANTNNDGAGNCTTIVSLGSPTVSDNCTSVGNIIITAKVGGVTINPLTYSFGIGSTTVVWTATDQSGNVSTPCNQTVTVIDNENPTINCPANVQVAANALCTATAVALGTPTTNDNCSVASVTNNAPVAFPVGNTTVTWTAIDTSGNMTTCTQTVTVFDPTAASISYGGSPFCASVVSGSPTINVLAGGPFSGIGYSSTAGLIINSSTGEISPSVSTAGTYVITFTFTGANGCNNTTTTSVTINPLPTAIVGVDRTIFRGSSTTVGAVAVSGNAYSWVSNPVGFTSSISNPSVSPLVTTTYTVTETSPQGCIRSNSVVITVKDNLVISKSLISSPPSKPGDNITYQISYSNLNNNGIAAQNVTITDLLPPITLFSYTSSSPAGIYNAGANTLSWPFASLAPGSGTITISGKVGVLGAYGYDAASYYISTGSSTQTINNSASIANAVTPTIVSNIVSNSVSQSCGPNMPLTLNGEIHTSTNSNVFYFIELENTGNITDRFSLVNNNPAQTGDVNLTSVITDMAGNPITQTPWLNPGQKFGFLVQFTTPGGTPPDKTNHTYIKATSIICNTTAITDVSTYVYNGAQAKGCDLLISKTASSGSVVAGTNIIYTVTVRNLSSNKAKDVVIDDYLPASVNYVSSSQTGGAIVTWNSSTRLLRATRSGNYDFSDPDIVITITVATTCSSVPSVINTATVDNNNADNNLLNNDSSVTVTVLPNVSDPVTTSSVICTGSSATVTMPAPGADRNYKWYSAATGGTLLQINGNTYNTGVLTSSTTFYVSQYNTLSPACESNRTAVLVTVVSAPIINSQPVSHNSCSSPASFTYNVTGTFLSQQWQESTDGGLSWINLANTGVYSGVATQTLTISDVTGLNGYLYKCILNSSSCFTLTSNVVSIIGLPIITTQPLTQLDCEGASVNFTAAASGTGLTYIWQRKKPTDASFITIPIEGNVSYPLFPSSTRVIKIDNVGSAQSPSGTQYQVIVSNSSTGCSVTSTAATLLVNEVTGISPIATNVIRCYGTDYSYTVSTSAPPPGSVVSYQWKSSVASGPWTNVVDDLIHFSGANTATLQIIKGTPAQSAEYKVLVIFTSSGANCNVTTTLTRRITFLPELTPPVATIIQPDCITPTGSVTLSGLPASGTWTLTRSGASSATTTGSGTSTIITGLALGTYTYTVTLGTCTSVPSPDVVIQAATTAIWNGSGWTNGPPAFNQALEFTGSYTSSGDLTACSCTVTNGAVVFKPTHTLKITNWVRVNGGSLTFEDRSSLVQINNVSNTNSGNIRYERQTTVIRKMDYTYWSSPVAGFTLGSVSPNTAGDKMYSYDSSIDDWKQESPATSMVQGVGYIIRGPQNYVPPMPPSTYEAPFVGIPNNGHYEITGIFADRSYLLGNPYPSALDADAFLDANQNVLDGTLYFWTHNTPIAIGTPDPGSGLYAYSGNDYASYNRTGGVGTAAAPSASTGGLNTNIPSGKIASGQGFFGSSKVSLTGTKIIFDNAMRVGVGLITGNNSQFFKTKTPKSLEKHRIWLNLTNIQGAFKQTLIGYVTDATNGYEDRFDGESYDGNDFLDFYSVLQDKNLTIQGRVVPFDENDEIPLGYRVALDGTFTIKIGKTDGMLSNQTVYLEDKLTSSVINLKEGNYTFTSVAGTFDERFVLRYKDKTLSIDETEAEVNNGIIALYSNNYKTLIIRNNVKDATVNSVTLFNITGQKIAYWDVKGREQTSIQIPIKNLPAEIYVVKIKTTKGDFSKKIIIK